MKFLRSYVTIAFMLLLTVMFSTSAFAERRIMDTDGRLSDREYRNPNIRYYYDYRDYRPISAPRYDYREHYRNDSNWDNHRPYYWNSPKPCGERNRHAEYYRRPAWRY